MLLTKWYGDWIGPAGPRVVYAAALRLGPLTLGFEGGHCPVSGERSAFRTGAPALPEIADGSLRWPSREGIWSWSGARSRPHELAGPGGGVTWDPVVANGLVSGPGASPGQRGYAERLTLAIPPWSLGIRTLRWGRFCGERTSLSWIEWTGERPLRLAHAEGHTLSLHRAGLDGVEADGVSVAFADVRAFVESPLASGLLKDMPWPRRIRPLAFLDGVERKYAGRGAALGADGSTDVGDVLFEEVEWAA